MTHPFFRRLIGLLILLICPIFVGCSDSSDEGIYVEGEQTYDIYCVHVKSTLNVRAEPSKNAQKVASLKNGDRVQVEAKNNKWARIIYTDSNNNNRFGYVYSEYLELVERAPQDPGYYIRPSHTFVGWLKSVYRGSFMDAIARWICENPWWTILIGILMLGAGAFVGNWDAWFGQYSAAFMTFLPLHLAGILAGFCIDWVFRCLGFLDIWSWIIGEMLGNDGECMSFGDIVLVLISDWMSLLFMFFLYYTVFRRGASMTLNETWISYSSSILANLSCLPIVAVGLGIHSLAFVGGESMLYDPPALTVMYGIVILIWLILSFTRIDAD